MLADNSTHSMSRATAVGTMSVPAPVTEKRRVPTADALLGGELTIPAGARGVVVFADAGPSDRRSACCRAVAESLMAARIAALQLELLTDHETAEDLALGRRGLDAERLGRRVIAAIDWVDVHRELRGLPVGCFGEATGAAAGLIAAAERSRRVWAVVSCGGRPDLARGALGRVIAPTLLIVSDDDRATLERARTALRRLGGEARMRVVPDGGGLPDARTVRRRISALSADWLCRLLEHSAAALRERRRPTAS